MTERKLIVFDFDGTLVDSHGAYEDALKEFSEANGLSYDGKKMGLGYTDPHKNDLGWGIPLEQQPALLEKLNIFYSEENVKNKRFLPTIFPDTSETLALLAKDYDLAIVTARIRASLHAVLDHYNISQFFPHYRSLCCANERNYKIKPAPDALHCLLQDTQHPVDNVVVIGDTTADIEMANAAKAKSIAVLWGAHPEERLVAVQPTAFAGQVRDLPDVVAKIFNH